MMSKKYNHILMDEKNLKKLSKSELLNLLLKQHKSKIVVVDTKPSPKPRRPVPTPRKSVKDMVQQYEDNIIIPPPEFRNDYKPIPAPRTKKPSQAPIPTPRKSVKDMVQQYEDNIIIPPPEFRDDHKPIPLPKTKKPSKAPIPTPRTKKPSEKPVPEKRTIISQVEKALKGYTQSFDVELRDKKDPLLQLQKSRRAVEYLFNNLLVQTKGFKFVETLQVKFVKHSNDKKNTKKWLFQFNNRFDYQ